MAASLTDLTGLAATIADGGTPDWATAELNAADEESRARLDRLRSISDVARHLGIEGAAAREAAASPGPVVSDEELQPGAAWGPFRIVEHVGSGRFGHVYRAFDPSLDRDVALKLLRHRSPESCPEDTTLELDEQDAALIVEEGRLAARVRHPNVVTIHGAIRLGGETGIWMELVEGRTLEAELAERGPFDAASLAEVGIELARALEAVHNAGLVHRDVKATNVMRDRRGRVVLGDFGTGRHLGESDVDRLGLAGTPAYLAPEIFLRQPATPRSDIYSLGVLLFHLATGGYPVDGRSLPVIAQEHEHGRRDRLRSRRPDLPSALTRAIDTALEPDPGKRFESAADMERSLAVQPRPWLRPGPALAAALVVTIAAVTAFILGSNRVREASGAEGPSTGVVWQELRADLSARANLRSPAGDPNLVLCTIRAVGALAVCDLRDGSMREIRSGPGARDAVMSPDGRSIAYTWIEDPGGPRSTWSLRMIGADGSSDREVYAPGKSFDLLRWSADGRGAVVRLAASESEWVYQLVRGVDGAPETIAQASGPGDVSPDLSRLAIVQADATGKGGIVVVDLASGARYPVAPHPADDSEPLWAPDGQSLVFLSDRLGDRGIFRIDLTDGAVSEATSVHQVGRATTELTAFLSNDVLLVRLIPPNSEAFVAAADVARGIIQTPERLAVRTLDGTAGADWSPDNRTVAYLSEALRGHGEARSRLVVRNWDTGAERAFPLPGPIGSRLKWLADGRRIAVVHGDPAVVDLIDTGTGSLERVLEGRGGNINVAAGDEAIFYLWQGETVRRRVYRLDLRTRSTAVVYDAATQGALGSGAFAVSPDGRDLLVVAQPAAGQRVLRIVRADGSNADLQSMDPRCYSAVAWSPDGRHLAASCMVSPSRPVTLWIMPTEPGPAVQFELDVETIWDLSIRADGRALAFTAGNPQPRFYTLSGIGTVR